MSCTPPTCVSFHSAAIQRSNLEDVQAHQAMLWCLRRGMRTHNARGFTIPAVSSSVIPQDFNTRSAAALPDETVAAPTIRDTSFVVRLLTRPFMFQSKFNVPAAHVFVPKSAQLSTSNVLSMSIFASTTCCSHKVRNSKALTFPTPSRLKISRAATTIAERSHTRARRCHTLSPAKRAEARSIDGECAARPATSGQSIQPNHCQRHHANFTACLSTPLSNSSSLTRSHVSFK